MIVGGVERKEKERGKQGERKKGERRGEMEEGGVENRRGEGDRKSKEETSSAWYVYLNLAIMRSSGQHLTVSAEGHTQH